MPRIQPRPRTTGYPSNLRDEEWALVVPYLTRSREDSAHRQHDLRAAFNAVRWLVKTPVGRRAQQRQVVTRVRCRPNSGCLLRPTTMARIAVLVCTFAVRRRLRGAVSRAAGGTQLEGYLLLPRF